MTPTAGLSFPKNPKEGTTWFDEFVQRTLIYQNGRWDTLVTDLECSHCGYTAIISDSGLFAEDDGERCITCDWPGRVSACDQDDREIVWWCAEDPPRDPNQTCSIIDCYSCTQVEEDG